MDITAKIARPYYLGWLDSWKDMDIIKVVSGIRRAGKTTLLELFREKIAAEGIAKENIISINFEDPEIDTFPDYRTAWKFIRSKFPANGKAYVFLDEVQLVPDFELSVCDSSSLRIAFHRRLSLRHTRHDSLQRHSCTKRHPRCRDAQTPRAFHP